MASVGIVIGSKTDEPYIQPALDILNEFKVPYGITVLSAHRKPEKVREYALNARANGLEVIIAAAGSAAHLPGVVASWTTLPVIGVPLPTSDLKGMDSLYSIVQMPGGVPVGIQVPEIKLPKKGSKRWKLKDPSFPSTCEPPPNPRPICAPEVEHVATNSRSQGWIVSPFFVRRTLKISLVPCALLPRHWP